MKLLRSPAVVLSGFECSLLAPLLGRAVNAARNRGELVERELLDICESVEAARQLWAITASGSENGNSPHLELEASDTRLTTKEAAELLGVIPRRIRQMLEEGTLAGSRHGRAWRVDADAVRRERERRSA